MAGVAGNRSTVSITAAAHLVRVLSEVVLGDELAVIGHQESAIDVEGARRAGELNTSLLVRKRILVSIKILTS